MCNEYTSEEDHKKDDAENISRKQLGLLSLTEEQKKFIADLLDNEHCDDEK